MFNVDKSKIARLDRDENSKRKAVKNSSDWTVNPPKGYVKGKW